MEKVNEKEKEFRYQTWGPKYLFRGPRMEWGILILNPGNSLGAHYHNKVEETFYLLEGEAQLIVEGCEHTVREGDAFRLEPGERHNLLNKSASRVRAVFIKCPYEPEDKVNV